MKCPKCGSPMKTTGTRPRWTDSVLRYLRCERCCYRMAVKVTTVITVLWERFDGPK